MKHRANIGCPMPSGRICPTAQSDTQLLLRRPSMNGRRVSENSFRGWNGRNWGGGGYHQPTWTAMSRDHAPTPATSRSRRMGKRRSVSCPITETLTTLSTHMRGV